MPVSTIVVEESYEAYQLKVSVSTDTTADHALSILEATQKILRDQERRPVAPSPIATEKEPAPSTPEETPGNDKWYLDCYHRAALLGEEFPVMSYGPATISQLALLREMVGDHFHRTEILEETRGQNPLPPAFWPGVE